MMNVYVRFDHFSSRFSFCGKKNAILGIRISFALFLKFHFSSFFFWISDSFSRLITLNCCTESLTYLLFFHMFYFWRKEKGNRNTFLSVRRGIRRLKLMSLHNMLLTWMWIGIFGFRFLCVRSLNTEHEQARAWATSIEIFGWLYKKKARKKLSLWTQLYYNIISFSCGML